MSNVSELVEIGHRAKRLIELLESARLSALDFDNRQHLQVIQLCLDMAIDRAEKIRVSRTAATRPQ
jgi:hypothetical protein